MNMQHWMHFNMKLYAVLALLIVLFAVINHAPIDYANAKEDPCTPFDAWVGGERFDYTIDQFGNWNFPPDVELQKTIMFPKAGIWKYYSIQTDTTFIIVFRDFDVTGTPLGTHDICVYKLAGLGMSEN